MKYAPFIKKKSIWIICLLSFCCALFYNEVNLKQIPKEKTRAGETILTSDGASYINPAMKFHKEGIWREGETGKQGYFLRPPGYGIFYLFFLKTAAYPLALKFLKIAQLLLFSASVYWIFYISLSVIKEKKIALITSLIYGVSPFFIGFIYYTLTETITPQLVILFVFLLFKALHQNHTSKKKNGYYFLASLTFAYILIVRPQIGLLGLLIPLFVVYDYWKISIKRILINVFVLSVVSFSFFGAWQYRNYKIADEFVGLHPIYFSDGNNFYRPTLKAYWNFVGGFAQKGETSYSYMIPLWQAAIKGDTSIVYIQKAIDTFPKKVITHFGKNRLIHVFRSYQLSTLYQKDFYEKQLPMPRNLSKIELKSIHEFDQLTTEYKKEFWLDYHIISPLKVFKTMAFHSNLSLYIFQKTYRGTWWMESIRVLFFAIHALLFLIMIMNLFYFKKENILFYGINVTVFIYVFFLCYFQRGIEERYTLPILPLLLIGLTLFSQQFVNRLKRFFNSVALRSE